MFLRNLIGKEECSENNIFWTLKYWKNSDFIAERTCAGGSFAWFQS